MSIVVIPAYDYSASAFDAESVGYLDLRELPIGSRLTCAFRVGNRSDRVQKLTLSVDDPITDDTGATTGYLTWLFNSPGSIDPSNIPTTLSLTLPPGGCSDTVTLDLLTTVDDPAGWRTAVLVSDTDFGTQQLASIDYNVVGINENRGSELTRRGDFTDNVSDLLARLSEPIRLHRFDPLPYDPDDRTILYRDGTIITQADVCARLDPYNDRWGYFHTSRVIAAHFSAEHFTVRESFTQMNTAIEFQAGATLYLPAESDLQRSWALFAPARASDREQYKRTVYIFARRGVIWALHNILSVYRGQEIAYQSADVVQLTTASNGRDAGYNPFGFTFERGSDVPYSYFICQPPDFSLPDDLSERDPYT